MSILYYIIVTTGVQEIVITYVISIIIILYRTKYKTSHVYRSITNIRDISNICANWYMVRKPEYTTYDIYVLLKVKGGILNTESLLVILKI